MARTLELIQDNKINDFELLTIHNPLFFLLQLNSSDGVFPDFLNVNVHDLDISGTMPIWTGRAQPYKDIYGVARQYIFSADINTLSILMPEIVDLANQPIDSLFIAEYASKRVRLFFYDDITNFTNTYTDFVALQGASQIGELNGACKLDYNEPKVYTCAAGSYVYVYCFCDNDTSIITVDNQLLTEVNAVDFDGYDFHDYDGEPFKILVP
jgi:hypothetical protein